MNRLTTSLALAAALCAALSAQERGEVNVYCSLDAEYSKELFVEFQAKTGIRVIDNMDTEDNKTIAMVNRIISEKDNPRCDVYWNNEVGHTMRLQRMGLLQPYLSPNAATIPPEYKDAEGYWTGLAARARIIIYNTGMVKDADKPTRLEDLADPARRGQATMARPLTGTTYTHVAALFAYWGESKTKSWLDRIRLNDVSWLAGNAMTMRDVGEGARAWGMTDTDDANVSKNERKHPTDIIIPDQGEGEMGVLVIPNSVMIVKGARNVENAKLLVDWILSPEVEAKLAAGRSAQIPLHPGVAAPAHVLRLDRIKAMPVDWRQVGDMLERHGPYLNEVFQGGGERAGEKSKMVIIVGAIALIVVLAYLGSRHRADAPR